MDMTPLYWRISASDITMRFETAADAPRALKVVTTSSSRILCRYACMEDQRLSPSDA